MPEAVARQCRGLRADLDPSYEGNEGLLLVHWTSLHLDVLARERGLKRMAMSLYEIS